MVVIHQHGAKASSLVGMRWAALSVSQSSKTSNKQQVLLISGENYVAVYRASSVEGSSEEGLCLKTWTSEFGAEKPTRSARGTPGRKGKAKTENLQVGFPAVSFPGSSTLFAIDKTNEVFTWDYFQESLHLPAAAAGNLGASRVVDVLTSERMLHCVIIVQEDGMVQIRRDDNQVLAEVNLLGANGGKIISASLPPATSGKVEFMLGIVNKNSETEKTELAVHHIQVSGSFEMSLKFRNVICEVPEGNQLEAMVFHSNRLVTLVWEDKQAQSVKMSRTGRSEIVANADLDFLGSFPTMKKKVNRKRGRASSISNDFSLGALLAGAVSTDANIIVLGSGDSVIGCNAALGVEVSRVDYKDKVDYLEILPKAQVIAVALSNGDVLLEDYAAENQGPFAPLAMPQDLASVIKASKVDHSNILEVADLVDLRAVLDDPNLDSDIAKQKLEEGQKVKEDFLKLMSNKKAKIDEKVDAMKEGIVAWQTVCASVSIALKQQDWDTLNELLVKKVVSVSTVPELIPTLLANDQLELLYICLCYVKDIEETAAALILKHLIEKTETKILSAFPKNLAKRIEAIKSNFKRQKRENRVLETLSVLDASEQALVLFVMALMTRPINDVFMIQALNSTRPETLVTCLQLASRAFIVNDEMSQMDTFEFAKRMNYPQRETMLVPNLEQVLEWIGVFVDISYIKVGSQAHSGLKQALESVSASCKGQLEVCERLCDLQVPVSYCLRDHKIAPSTTIGDYHVETIHL